MAANFQSPAFPSSFGAPGVPAAGTSAPSGTFVPGTKVQVGAHRVIIEKYLSEGGFAHVYVVRLPKPIDGEGTAVLKRVAVPDKEALATMRTEVETMKKLRGRRHIVTYIDSHASQLKAGGYEVFLLMEYCNGGGLIDFMNTRLQNRLTEPEILKIFSDVAQGVACMHYLKPPLLHRDLKVENVLIAKSGSSRLYKLCDFGSTAPPRPAATNAADGRLIEEDVQKHTTLQYRSPEMVDVYRKQPIDEKSDIWALGVLLYKLCYYKTPFEDQGQMAILNASFKYPAYPAFSDRLKKLIASLLREQPHRRPNIYEVVREVAAIRGTDIPIKDIYAGRSHSEARKNQHLPVPDAHVPTPPVMGAVHAPPPNNEEQIPDIAPMRRGRPSKPGTDAKGSKPSASPLRPSSGDPFAALDSKPATTSDPTFDEINSRFPALDDFSILHEKSEKFSFDGKAEISKPPKQDISQRVTNALADDAFANVAKSDTSATPLKQSGAQAVTSKPLSRPISSGGPQVASAARPNPLEQRASKKSTMVSTATGASPPPSPPPSRSTTTSNRPIFRIPSNPTERSLSQPRDNDWSAEPDQFMSEGSLRPSLSNHRSKSQVFTTASKSARQSFEHSHRTSYLGSSVDDGVQRSSSMNSKLRPSSMQSVKPNILRRLSRERPSVDESSQNAVLLSRAPTGEADEGEEAVRTDSNVEYLKMMEGEDHPKRKDKRLSGGSRHVKRASMPSVSLSGTKQLFAGRFGEAFRKFEASNASDQRESSRSPVRGPSDLTPIAGSEATDGRSDDGNVVEETEELPPEMRRELERRRLSQEERRVADAAAAYKQRVAQGGDPRGASSKAASIQSKVKSLLDESGRASPSPTKTAEGYGRFTEAKPLPDAPPVDIKSELPPRTSSRQPQVNPIPTAQISQYPSTIVSKPEARPIKPPPFQPPRLPNTMSAPLTADYTSDKGRPSLEVRSQRPTGPPKPQPKPHALRTGDRRPQSPLKPSSLSAGKPTLRERSQILTPEEAIDAPIDDDWEVNFSKRYPDLSGLELVETEIDQRDRASSSLKPSALGREMRVRDV